ncbi:hypothetical protein [Crocosphaera sp.]|uniref:hypothetical protein n=1 Tax=Crocosphaera sp. TaxID=2729996 RepID=UPI002616A72A|nr:hypothetical protein [Crocosphaera sp.]MDJ0582967.1 hypothetical protein [Crocosphaera sp.]
MTKRYLSLVLVEVPDKGAGTMYHNWFDSVSVESASVKDGLLEIVFSNEEIRVFNGKETEDILSNISEILERTILTENPIPGSALDTLFDED